jgi:hypothetical protein
VDAVHAVVGADFVTNSEVFQVVNPFVGIVGVADLFPCLCPDQYPNHAAPGLTDAQFLTLYGFERVKPGHHALWFRSGHRL